MTLLTRTIFLTIALLVAQSGLAQTARIAIVDLQRLTLGTDEGKKASDRLEKRYQEISTSMQGLQKSIEEKENTLATQARALSDTRKAQLAREIDAEKKEFTRKNEDYQTELQDLEQQLTGPLMQKAEAILTNFLKEKGYTILFNVAAENGNVIWYNKDNDVTDEVIKVINAEAKAAAVPAPAASPASTAKPPAAPSK